MAFGAFATSTAVAEPAARKKSPVALLLLLPGLFYLGLFFLVPLFSLVITSLQEPDPVLFGQFQNAFRWENYVTVLGQYWPQAVRSFGYAAVATLCALLIGFPLAYFIGITLRRWPLLQALALVLVIARSCCARSRGSSCSRTRARSSASCRRSRSCRATRRSRARRSRSCSV
jgi:spermidine/putrescine transport system permease protein